MNVEYTSLQGKWAVVTGGARGIGAATCRALVHAGARVVAVDVLAEDLNRLCESEDNLWPHIADVSDPELPGQLEDTFEKLQGDIDILVNNAGIGKGHHALDTTDGEMHRYLDVNLVSAFRLSRWASRRFVAQRRSGAIVNVASVFGVVGSENCAGYSTSKAALIGLTRQMANDLGPSGVRVNAVAPGLIETPLVQERIQTQPWRTKIMVDQSPIRRLGQPEDVARAIRFLASDEAAYITGHTLAVDGGWMIGRFPKEHPIDPALISLSEE